MLAPTPSQTAGPFVALGTGWAASGRLVPPDDPAAIVLTGRIFDGALQPVADAMVEFWQADRDGGFPPGAWKGFTRALAGPDGSYSLVTVKPGASGDEAPHVDISVFARGLLQRVMTRAYFDDEVTANAADPVLASLPAGERETLLARRDPGGGARYVFDIYLQGTRETVFFAP